MLTVVVIQVTCNSIPLYTFVLSNIFYSGSPLPSADLSDSLPASIIPPTGSVTQVPTAGTVQPASSSMKEVSVKKEASPKDASMKEASVKEEVSAKQVYLEDL